MLPSKRTAAMAITTTTAAALVATSGIAQANATYEVEVAAPGCPTIRAKASSWQTTSTSGQKSWNYSANASVKSRLCTVEIRVYQDPKMRQSIEALVSHVSFTDVGTTVPTRFCFRQQTATASGPWVHINKTGVAGNC